MVWATAGLTAGKHTLRLVKHGGDYMLIDALSVTAIPPAAPTGVTAQGASAQVTLAWASSAGASTYNLYRGTASSTEVLLKSGLSVASYVDGGLTNGTAYFYRVSAVNGAGEGAQSSEVSATPAAPASPPVLVNDTDATITYTGQSWGYAGGRGLGDLQDDIHYASADGDSLSYAFTGTGIGYVTETNGDQGGVDVYLDGAFRATVSCASAARHTQQMVWATAGLTAGTHTLRLVKHGGGYMLIDALSVIAGK